jgi:hypothetical protein
LSAHTAGWRGAVALGLACTVAALAYAEPQKGQEDPKRGVASFGESEWINGREVIRVSNEVLERESASGGFGAIAGDAGTAVQFSSGFEPPCDPLFNGNGYIGCDAAGGYICGRPQNCEWHTSIAAQPTFLMPVISNLMPLNGLQNLHFQYDANQESGNPDLPVDSNARNWAFSDDIVPTPTEGVQHLSLWIRVAGAAPTANSFIIQPQAPTQELLTTVFILDDEGMIWIGDDDTCDDGTFLIVNTLVPWVANEYRKIDICLDTVNDRIRYFYDDQFIWSTGAGEGGMGGGDLGCGVFAGSIIEHVLIRYNENGVGADTMDIDDVLIETDNCPEPSGACCNFDGGDGCQVMTEPECDATGSGVYGGVNTDCANPDFCPAVLTCATATGDCFEAHVGAGCDDPTCCLQVCLDIPFCCQADWSIVCVQLANELCQFILCEQPDVNCQSISTANASTSVTGSFIAADNFTPAVTGTVNALCWYGAYLPDEGVTDDFTVRYYTCTDGVPDIMIAEYNQTGLPSLLVVQPRSGTNLQVAGTAEIYEYQATHPNVNVHAGTVYFIEIVNNIPIETHTWFWEWSNDPASDGTSFQKPDGIDYARYFINDTDLAFCLNLELADTTGLCEIPPPVPCHMDLPTGDLSENEPCGSDPDLNLGCTVDQPGPYPFTDIASPSTDPAIPTVILGEADGDAGERDIDWYRFTVPPGLDGNLDGEVFICLAAAAELPIGAVIVTEDPSDGECGAVDIAALDTIGFECGASLAVGYPCMNCPWDFETLTDDIVNIADFLAILAQWDVTNPPCDDNGSCDTDGNGCVDVNDFLSFLSHFGNCEGHPSSGNQFGNDYVLELSITDLFEDCFPE